MRIIAYSLEKYKDQVKKSIEKLTTLGWNDPSKPPSYILKQCMMQYNILIDDNASLGHRDSASFPIRDKHGHIKHIILIDKKFQNDPNKEIYIKKYIIHEIGHFISNHKPTKIGGWIKKPYMAGLKETLAEREEIEQEAEVMGAVILFWPEKTFKQIAESSKFDLSAISKKFRAELDCCAKYILLLFPGLGHYIKYNVAQRDYDDYFVPLDYDQSFEVTINDRSWVLRETVLGRCIEAHAISVDDNNLHMHGETSFNAMKVYCNAFYRPKSRVEGIKEDDKIICMGHKLDA